ncbi:peripherin-2a isoform X1 [Mastacembelus armatus]|uniref:Peripherin-2-like n=1 Tax=Mastacembelus armatus TaxID=205130 RepID=A0A3Q3KT48_9TELE|nr:uncharacterized protein C17orf80-like isoform X1 [Mastacembelus armatus]
MSSEVCPFCGKTYKRLKSHLPHCKAAASSKTSRHQQDVTAKQTSSPQPAAALSQSTQATSVTTDLHTKKSKKVSGVTSGPLQSSSSTMPSKNADTPSSSSSTLPPTVKKKQKLADQIKMAITPSYATVSSPALSKPKKKSVGAVIEAVDSEQVSKRSLKETKSVSADLLSDNPNSSTTAQTETKMNPDKDSVSLDLLSTDTKAKVSHKKKVSKTTKTAQFDSMDVKIKESTTKPLSRDNVWEDNMGEIENLSVNKIRLTPRSIHQTRITLQDVRAALCRPKATSQSSWTNILSQVDSGDNLNSKSRGGTSLSPAGSQKDSLVTAKTLSDQLPPISSQHTELQSVKNKSSSVTLQHDGSPQPKTIVPATPLLSGHVLSQVSQHTVLPHTVSVTEGLKMGHHRTGLFSISPPAQFYSPHPFLLAPPAMVDTRSANKGSTAEASQLDVRNQTAAHSRPEGALTQRHLGQVRLREVPEWLFSNTPSRPRDAVKMVQRGWQWYYRKYIDVKKGGVGGLGMLLAGYCVLSYIWSYPHTKRDRWRKYH